MILVSIERMKSVSPSILEALDAIEVILATHGDDKVFILDSPAISEDDFVIFSVDLVDTDVIRLADVLGDDLSGGSTVIELGDAVIMGHCTCPARRGCVQLRSKSLGYRSLRRFCTSHLPLRLNG